MEFISDPRVKNKFDSYPPHVKGKMNELRDLVIEVAQENGTITKLEETLKWGEPSYVTKKGSTLRMDWKSKSPNQYALYFTCSTELVPTFKLIFGDLFRYEGTRAVVFDLDCPIPIEQVKECMELALIYHTVKHKPLLGKGL